jgi:hypothetical protein
VERLALAREPIEANQADLLTLEQLRAGTGIRGGLGLEGGRL